MDAKTAWYLFETTGNVEAYLLYQNVIHQQVNRKNRNRPVGGSGFNDAGRTVSGGTVGGSPPSITNV